MSIDSLVTMLVAAFLVPAAVVPYYFRVRKRERETKSRYEKSKISGQEATVFVHPHIDALICIGCGGCVRACVEGVLGVIDGKPVLVHGTRCVGHGFCVEACPVGAITLKMVLQDEMAIFPRPQSILRQRSKTRS